MTASADADAAGSQAARRERLRDYQAQLLERVQAAQNGVAQVQQQLGVGVGNARYLIDLTEAGEIVAPPPLRRVPLTQPWYLGLANVRGSLLGVIDLARYLDLPSDAPAPQPRLVSLAPRLGVPCALLVGSVYGLRSAEQMTPEGAQLRDAQGQAWTPLSLAALVREARFLQVGLAPTE